MHNGLLRILAAAILLSLAGCALVTNEDRVGGSLYAVETWRGFGKGKVNQRHCASAYSKQGVLIVLDGTATDYHTPAKITFYNPDANILIEAYYMARVKFEAHTCTISRPESNAVVTQVHFKILTNDDKRTRLKNIVMKTASQDDVVEIIRSSDNPFTMKNITVMLQDWVEISTPSQTGDQVLQKLRGKISYIPGTGPMSSFSYRGTVGKLLDEIAALSK